MATVRTDRGQLILVTGLAVAVTLVAMVLLLNTVIYTQNLATRGAQVEDGEAISFRGEVVADVGGLLDAENREEHGSWAEARDNVRDAVFQYDRLVSGSHAKRGTVAEIDRETLSFTEGVLVRQNATPSGDYRNFTNADEAETDWTLAGNVGTTDVPGARNFRLTVSASDLAADEADAFAVRLDGTDTRRVYVYESGGEIVVSDGDGADTCTVSESEATIDLTAETVEGSACGELDYPTEGPYDVVFENPENATGTYELTLNASESSPVVSGNFADAGATESPREAPAVYAAHFEIHFETSRVTFHTAVRSAPGEPR